MKYVLPYPPAANVYWRVWRGRAVTSTEARRYKALVYEACPKKPIDGPVSVTISVYRPRKSGDLDGRLKVTLDALQQVAYFNDSQIVELHAYRYDDKSNPRCEVVVDKILPDEQG